MNSFFPARFAPLPTWEGVEEDQGAASSDSPSDEALMECLQCGKPDALSSLFNRYSRIVRSISARILRDSAEAEDLVQDLFLFIQRKCGVFDRSKSSARSWIIQMAYYRALERRRYLTTHQCDPAPNGDKEAVGSPTTEDDYSAEAVFGRNGLSKVLETCSADQRETLRLYFFEGYTLAEISEKLGQPYGNVRHHYYRAIDKLRKHMFASNVWVVDGHGK